MSLQIPRVKVVMMIRALLLVSAVAACVSAHSYKLGGCPSVEPVAQFDMNKVRVYPIVIIRTINFLKTFYIKKSLLSCAFLFVFSHFQCVFVIPTCKFAVFNYFRSPWRQFITIPYVYYFYTILLVCY